VRKLLLDAPDVSQEATFEPVGDGRVRIVTGAAPWQHAVGFPLDLDRDATDVFALVTCLSGEVGVGVLASDGSKHVAPETLVAAGEKRLATSPVNGRGERGRWLMVRNGAQEIVSECDILAAYAGSVPSVELTEEEIAIALRDPAAARAGCARRAWPPDILDALGVKGVPLRVVPPPAPLSVPPPQILWSGTTETTVLNTAHDLGEQLAQFRPGTLEPHVAVMPADAMRSYLRMNVVRVVRLVEAVRRRGLEQGRVLEVGAWFGSFALALRRLGYDVTAVDRYASYGEAFDPYVELMEREGVSIVSTKRESELDEIAALGRFDIVLAGAVIEHIPHTPRTLLETLFGAVRSGGLLLLDTPNVARYWNRRALERGETIFQPIEDQYFTEQPWEGHHREYTARELQWMLERVGCEAVEVEFVDYNMLQFETLSAGHTECLAAIVEDPSQADTLLVGGRRPS
jgi:2-polyprenyl-3-methyl-5-hydroxy-6-metoxy-1,4-benzoquinol methylase